MSNKWVKFTRDYHLLPFNVHERAKQMLADGYIGQNMDHPHAEDFIYLAADDPDVEKKLPERGIGFWRWCDLKYRAWKARDRLDRPEYRQK
jgi:hypothetical protein